MHETSTLSKAPSQGTDLAELQTFEKGLVDFIGSHGLPTRNVLVGVPERFRVFQNVAYVLDKLDPSRRAESIYISKFLAAAASGLFDAALNYLWDETIYELRHRVAQYDLAYFFDVAVANPEKRKKLKGADDLPKIDDSDLIKGANEIGLVSDLGFKHLDFIRYMRNWASAAHPNQNDITGLQLISWLETCITEVITLPPSNVVVEIKRLLANIKTNVISVTEANTISSFFTDLDQDRANSLASGFFGIYVDPALGSQVRQNIHLLAPRLWPRVAEHTRRQFGIKYAQFAANGEQQQQTLARQFLDIVSAVAYIPDSLRGAEIQNALEDLLGAHHNFNNFHNEPPFARRLQALVQPPSKVPSGVMEDYVLGLVEVFLSNGNGIAWAAEATYRTLFTQFDADQALVAVLSFRNKTIASRLQFSLCQQQFRELLALMRKIVSAPAVLELIEAIEQFTGPLHQLQNDTTIKSKVQQLKTILGIS